jgi:hypothetical protein
MKNAMFSQNIQSFQKNLVKERSNLAAPPWAFVISVFNTPHYSSSTETRSPSALPPALKLTAAGRPFHSQENSSPPMSINSL